MLKRIYKLFRYRTELLSVVYVAIFSVCYYLAFALRLEFDFWGYNFGLMLNSMPLAVGVQYVVFYWMGIYRQSHRYVGMQDMIEVGKATVISVAIFGTASFFAFQEPRIPRSIVAINSLLSLISVLGFRMSMRYYYEFRQIREKNAETRRVVILGAGNTGEVLVREMRKYAMQYQIIGFLDDDMRKQGLSIQSVPVIGRLDDLPHIVESAELDDIFIAIPSATGKVMRRIVKLCEETNIPYRTIPGLDRLIDGRTRVSQLRSVDIEDLLRREPVQLETDLISSFLGNRMIMVTGAGGSIGSEICRQVIRFMPRSLILVDHNENALYEIDRELRKQPLSVSLFPCVADVADALRIEEIFQTYRPEVVFHAAAYKHVPMMEINVREAVKNNVFGTKVLADLAAGHGISSFVMISTDKAVNPSSVMGATKRLAEIYINGLKSRRSPRFITVRFGNVLDSRGSVIPLFREQIQQGGPVTITHPEMKRYFMTIPEASQLVMQAAAMGQGGELFVLDMGEPVKIIDLARDLIELSGLKPDEDIPIEVTGIRPGEKLFEELCLEKECVSKTRHEKIYIGTIDETTGEDFYAHLEALEELTRTGTEATIRVKLTQMVPGYKYTPAPGNLG